MMTYTGMLITIGSLEGRLVGSRGTSIRAIRADRWNVRPHILFIFAHFHKVSIIATREILGNLMFQKIMNRSVRTLDSSTATRRAKISLSESKAGLDSASEKLTKGTLIGINAASAESELDPRYCPDSQVSDVSLKRPIQEVLKLKQTEIQPLLPKSISSVSM